MPENAITFYDSDIVWKDKVGSGRLELFIEKPQTLALKTGKTTIEMLRILPDDCEFRAVINPPERVRLNYGDDWLPYYIYAGYEITSNGERILYANPEVTLEISYSGNKGDMKTYKSNAFEGAGHFERIDISSPSEPPDITLTLSADGVKPLTISYKA